MKTNELEILNKIQKDQEELLVRIEIDRRANEAMKVSKDIPKELLEKLKEVGQNNELKRRSVEINLGIIEELKNELKKEK